MERRRAERERRRGRHRLLGGGDRLQRPREEQDAFDDRDPVRALLGAPAAHVEQPVQPEAVLGVHAGPGDQVAGDVLVEHRRLARPPRRPVVRALEAGGQDALRGRRERARRVRDLPFDARLALLISLEVVTVRHAVDAEDALGVRGQPRGLQRQDDGIELLATGRGEAGERDLRRPRRLERRAGAVALSALGGADPRPLRLVLELRGRPVEVRVAGIEHVAAIVEGLPHCVLEALEGLLEDRADLAQVRRRGRDLGLRLHRQSLRCHERLVLRPRLGRLRLALRRLLLGARVGPRHLLLLLGRELDGLPHKPPDHVAHRATLSDESSRPPQS